MLQVRERLRGMDFSVWAVLNLFYQTLWRALDIGLKILQKLQKQVSLFMFC